jgi:hypothetical protein
MKPLTKRQARRCEDAKNPRCRCRCGGRLHGAQRKFEFLGPDDPPFVQREPMRGHGAQRGSNVGLTDQTTPDLYGIVAPLQGMRRRGMRP